MFAVHAAPGPASGASDGVDDLPRRRRAQVRRGQDRFEAEGTLRVVDINDNVCATAPNSRTWSVS